MTVEERVIELEIRSAHFEKLASELSEVIYQQQKDLDLMRVTLDQLRDRMGADPGLVESSRDDKPPHY